MSIFFKTFLFLVMAGGLFADSLPSATPATAKKEMVALIPEPEKNASMPIDLPAPVGEDMKGIIIPQYDADGHLVMNFIAEKARKIDEHQVQIESLKIGFFEKEGKDVTVLVPHGIFNLETKMLSADSRVTIQREDFEMTGESATFDTTKRFGTMKGHVHTEIRNSLPAEE